MDKSRSKRKKRDILKPFRKNERLVQRLIHYIGEQGFEADELEIRSKINKETNRKRKKQESDNSEADLLYMIDTKRTNREDSFTSDSEASLDDASNKTPSNLLNISLRSVYSNGLKKDESLTVKDSDCGLNCNNLTSSSSSGNNLVNSTPSKNTEELVKLKNIIGTENRKLLNEKPTKSRKTVPIQRPLIKFSDIGGLDDKLIEICELLRHLKHPYIYETIGVKNPQGLLLHGPPGCGKTLIAHAIADELKLPFIKVAATELVSGVSGESESKIRELFENAELCASCILFIDEIDAITPKRETVQREMEKRIVTQLLKCMDELNMKDSEKKVMVIGATNRPHSLDPALRRAGRFDREISIGIPNESARLQILKVVCRKLKISPDFKLEWLARNTPGYVGADLMAITREAANIAVNRAFQHPVCRNATFENGNSGNEIAKVPLSLAISWLKDKPPLTKEQLKKLYVETQDFESAFKVYVPSSKREGFAIIPNVTWKDVGALKDVQDVLQTSILWPIKYQELFKKFHLISTTGVLLSGPKGCGKTLLAKAVANECSINFLSVKGPELLSMYVGESERAVRECFQRARNSAPCVIFFDEIDALCPSRSSSNENPAAERVVNQLLTEIDGVEDCEQIFVMGATNRPDNIDSAMLRPGRFEKIIFIDVPNQEGRLDILQKITKNGTRPKIACDVNLESLSNDSRCQGFSGADLKSLVREASFNALKDYIADTSACVSRNFEIKLCHFDNAFSNVRPSVTVEDQHFFKNWNMKKLI